MKRAFILLFLLYNTGECLAFQRDSVASKQANRLIT
ncbi:MAG: hypothetical protein ACJAXX_003159, partial [Roseivirga sp.]